MQDGIQRALAADPAALAVREREASGALVEFLNRYLADRAAGVQRTLADYQALFPAHADAIAREHAALEAEPLEGESEVGVHARYQALGEIARGGMGRIVKVWDRDLARELAMKTLRTDGAAPARGTSGAGGLSRFLAEARVTGQLQHPGIVPVHQVGVDADGTPFFTMALVRGSNLETVIASLHGLDRAGPAPAPGWSLARVVDVLVRVCEAVAFAHSRGIVHRDLKPANVMVGEFGETYVMDWGLAKVVAGAGGSAAAPDVAALPDAVSLTAQGDVLGTPPYMAPEQACGDVARIGPAVDVYAIGAILYHVLTGHMPFCETGASTSSRVVLERVRSGPPVAVATLCPDAPAELIAICDQAMAREPAARYASAAALGDDLRAFRDLRVVRAYETGALAELRKWVRRNRLAAAAGAAAVLALAVGLGASLVLMRKADAHASRAEAGYGAALDAVDRLLMRVGESSLKDVPGAEQVRRETLQDAREFYLGFLATHGQRPELRQRAAHVHAALGGVHAGLGEWDEAEAQRRAAIARYDELRAERPGSVELVDRLATACHDLGGLLSLRGRPADAEPFFARALALVAEARAGMSSTSSPENAGSEHPADVTLQRLEAVIEHKRGLAFQLQGQRAQAALAMRRAVELGSALEQRTTDPTIRKQLALSRNNLGLCLVFEGQVEEAEGHLQRAIASYEALLAATPRDPGLRSSLGSALNNLEMALKAKKEVAAAKVVNQRAVDLFADLVEEYPRVPDHHSLYGSQLNNRAIFRQNDGLLVEAAADLDEAVRQQRIALAAVPDHKQYRERLGNNLRTRLYGLKLLGRHEQIARDVDALLDLGRDNVKNWTNAGSMLLMAAALAAADPALDAGERARQRDELIARGVERLRQAMALGLRDPGKFAGEEFDPLRDHPAVRALLDDLERAAQAAAAQPRDASAK